MYTDLLNIAGVAWSHRTMINELRSASLIRVVSSLIFVAGVQASDEANAGSDLEGADGQTGPVDRQ